jgi:hypothetical protein
MQGVKCSREEEVAIMRTMTMKTMRPLRRTSAAVKIMQLKKLRMTPNHNVHVITPHGKVMLGRKGRKV